MDNTLLARLQPLRQRIDDIDDQVLQLLNERARAAQAIGDIKKEFDVDGAVLTPEREADITRSLQARNHGAVTAEPIDAVGAQVTSPSRWPDIGVAAGY